MENTLDMRTVHKRFKILGHIRAIYFGLLLVVASANLAKADIFSGIGVTLPVQSTDGSNIDTEALLQRINNISSPQEFQATSPLIRSERFFSRFIDAHIMSNCGQLSEFEQFSVRHGYEVLLLTEHERGMLENCLINVFQFADDNISVAAPGFYRRFSDNYVAEAVELGYRCGFRSQTSFSRFALTVWFITPSDLRDRGELWCLEDISSEMNVSRTILEDSLTLTLDHFVYLFVLFENWSDVVKYLTYESIVLERREEEQCAEAISQFRAESEITFNELLSSGCNSYFMHAWEYKND